MEKTEKITVYVGNVPVVFDAAVVIMTTLTCVLTFLIVYFAARRPQLVPTGMQNVMESIIDVTQEIVRSQFKRRMAHRFYGFAFSLFLFILIANQIGLILNFQSKGVDGHHYAWWKSPTADINVPIGMAIAITLAAHAIGIARSPKKYIQQYSVGSVPLSVGIFPLKLLSEFTKPMTHGVRLWANILAGEIMIAAILKGGASFFTGAPLVVWLGYSLVVGLIQAYVFTTIAMLYLGQKVGN